MAAGRPLRPNDPSVMSSVEAALTPTRRPGPLDFAWHWRWELGAAGILAATATLTAIRLGTTGLIAAAGAGLAVLSTLMCWPPARRWIVARSWCVITPHRIRAACAGAWVQTRGGRLPVVVSCVPTAFGERARLWLRAGLTADDLLPAREVLAAACWAAEARVTRDPHRAHRVTVDIIRKIHTERPRIPHPRTWPHSGLADGEGDAEIPASLTR